MLSKSKPAISLTLLSTPAEMDRLACDRIVRTGAMQEVLVLVLNQQQTLQHLTLLTPITGSSHRASLMGAPKLCQMAVYAHASTKCVVL